MKIFIGCASSNDIDEKYLNDCDILLDDILQNNDLIYGAYNNGIMNIAYNKAKKYNRKIIGIAPKEYESDLNNLDIDEKILVDNILQRTYKLITLSDIILFLPGGIGTINELFATIDMKRSGEIDKPIIIYNSNHYYDKLIQFLDLLYNDNFTSSDVKNCYFVASNNNDVVKLIKRKED